VDGTSNNALGESALLSNIHASSNTAVGDIALENNDSTGTGDGSFNTAVGAGALASNVDGNSTTLSVLVRLVPTTTGSTTMPLGLKRLAATSAAAATSP
jgi:hypothetical protein